MSQEPKRPTTHTSLRQYPWIVMHLRCHVCPRAANYRLAMLGERFGANALVGQVLRAFIEGCGYSPYDPARKPQKYGHRCGGYCPDLLIDRPPDLPPSLSGLTLIEGGKAEQLASEPVREERRRRVGESDDS